MNKEEQVNQLRKFITKGGDNIITLRKTNQSYITFDRSKVKVVDQVAGFSGHYVRVWFNDDSYEDFPNIDKEEFKGILNTNTNGS